MRFKRKSLNDYFEQSVRKAFDYTRGSRHCVELTDYDFVMLCLWRALSKSQSGRDFLQEMGDSERQGLKHTTYFDALSSSRRLAMLREVTDAMNRDMRQVMVEKGVDYLSEFPVLKNRVVVAGDGHAIEHACHSKRRKSGSYVCESSIHLIDLHTGLGEYLVTVQGDGERAHEMPSLRKALSSWSSKQGKTQEQPILVYDRAAVDKTFWSKMACAQKNGIRIITRCKNNMIFHLQAERDFDRDLEINQGVLSNQLVGQDNAICMRRVCYQNPEDGQLYEFLTSVMDLEPGLIAWLYFLRWTIEKRFDTFKNKLHEKKGWAVGAVAQEIQGRACNCTHNLLQVLLALFDSLLDIQEEKLIQKREKDLALREEKAAKEGRKLHPHQRVSSHLYQLSQQFIRLIRNLFFDPRPLEQLLPLLKRRLEAYH